MSVRLYSTLSGLSGIVGVILLGVSFATAVGPPADATRAELAKFGQQHHTGILWGAWLQAVGPVFIVLFAFALVHLAGASVRLSGWMTLFGASILMTVSLIEVTYYIGALFPDPEVMTSISLRVICAVQHLYFIVAAPALFLPLGIVLLTSRVLPRLFGHFALLFRRRFCGAGSCLFAEPDSACHSHRLCGNSGALVAGRRHHANRSKRYARRRRI